MCDMTKVFSLSTYPLKLIRKEECVSSLVQHRSHNSLSREILHGHIHEEIC